MSDLQPPGPPLLRYGFIHVIALAELALGHSMARRPHVLGSACCIAHRPVRTNPWSPQGLRVAVHFSSIVRSKKERPRNIIQEASVTENQRHRTHSCGTADIGGLER